jgi:hypothetical protein
MNWNNDDVDIVDVESLSILSICVHFSYKSPGSGQAKRKASKASKPDQAKPEHHRCRAEDQWHHARVMPRP